MAHETDVNRLAAATDHASEHLHLAGSHRNFAGEFELLAGIILNSAERNIFHESGEQSGELLALFRIEIAPMITQRGFLHPLEIEVRFGQCSQLAPFLGQRQVGIFQNRDSLTDESARFLDWIIGSCYRRR
jgi:hypothetical protein